MIGRSKARKEQVLEAKGVEFEDKQVVKVSKGSRKV